MRKSEIQELQGYLREEYPYLNQGGCGVFAYWFISRFGGKAIRLKTNKFLDKKTVKKSLKSNNGGENLAGYHFVVSFRNMLFDGHGFSKREGDFIRYNEKLLYPVMEYSKQDMLTAVVEDSSWNESFMGDHKSRLHALHEFMEDVDSWKRKKKFSKSWMKKLMFTIFGKKMKIFLI